eukprot:NODE_4964_length_328_cov_199.318996_g4353_i0.p3 GENE.NODE_4964_length_328_cov_199.318996_g4353_i0~~NODE_4964_length_328_cov_199.318996_g4353_i0.p3  ORF type:complete len:69 (+),score=21.26 NODE_4964_length_328_cov_199.318996_g4353_i0:30-209(+)
MGGPWQHSLQPAAVGCGQVGCKYFGDALAQDTLRQRPDGCKRTCTQCGAWDSDPLRSFE